MPNKKETKPTNMGEVAPDGSTWAVWRRKQREKIWVEAPEPSVEETEAYKHSQGVIPKRAKA